MTYEDNYPDGYYDHSEETTEDEFEEELKEFNEPKDEKNRSFTTVRARTFSPKELLRFAKKHSKVEDPDSVYPEDVDRPITRQDCLKGGKNEMRPCPFVSCENHLYLDINKKTGAMRLNYPHLEVWEMKESCMADVAERSGSTLEEVGRIMNLTRERIRQIEVRASEKASVNDQIMFGCRPCRDAGIKIPMDKIGTTGVDNELAVFSCAECGNEITEIP